MVRTMPPTTYLINLDSSSGRLAAMTSQLDRIGAKFERVPAFDGRELDLEALKVLPDADVDACITFMGRPFHGGEFGCYKSHLDCARRIVESGDDQALVLEDDVELSPELPECVKAISIYLSKLNYDWDLVHLGADRLKYTTDIGGLDVSGRRLVHAHYFPMTTSALLWSHRGASRFLAEYATVKMPVDNQFREYLTRSSRGFAVWPSLARQTQYDSTINPFGLPDKRRNNRNWKYGFLKRRRLFENKWIAIRNRRRSRRITRDRIPVDIGRFEIPGDGDGALNRKELKISTTKAYLINLDSGTERLRTVTIQLDAEGINFERVPAFDGRGLDNVALAALTDVDDEACLRHMGWRMYGSEYGCYKSHLDCALRIAESGDPYGLVFEDDVILTPDFHRNIEGILNHLNAAKACWDVVNLAPIGLKSGLTTKVGEIGGNCMLVHAHHFPLAASALLWSRRGVLGFLNNHSKVKMPIDRYLREILTRSDRGYAVWPPLARQSWNDSQIDIDGSMYDNRHKEFRQWPNNFIKQRRALVNRAIAFKHRVRAILSRAIERPGRITSVRFHRNGKTLNAKEKKGAR